MSQNKRRLLKNRLTAISLIVVAATTVSFVARADDPKFLEELYEESPSKSPRESRLIVAEKLREDVEAVDLYLPNLSPAEAEWVEMEWARLRKKLPLMELLNKNNQESQAFFKSREYLLREIKEQLTIQKNALDCVINRPKHELVCWLTLLHSLTEFYERNVNDVVVYHDLKLPKQPNYSTPAWIISGVLARGVYHRNFE